MALGAPTYDLEAIKANFTFADATKEYRLLKVEFEQPVTDDLKGENNLFLTVG